MTKQAKANFWIGKTIFIHTFHTQLDTMLQLRLKRHLIKRKIGFTQKKVIEQS
jgi:hypothetical protein